MAWASNVIEDDMRKHRNILSLGIIVLAICFVIAIIVGGQGININNQGAGGGAKTPPEVLNSPLKAHVYGNGYVLGNPPDINAPTTVMPAIVVGRRYAFVHVFDTAPQLDRLDKSYDVVQRANGTYDQVWHDPTDQASVPAMLNPGDTIVDHFGPERLMMVHPPPFSLSPTPTPTP